MKKLLALTLALMLVLASAALAETANILKLSDIQVAVSNGEQEQVIDLGDLNAQIAIGAADGIPTIEVDADDGSQALLCGVMQIVDGKVVMDVEGMERPVAAAIPTENLAMLGGDPTEALGEAFANMGQLSATKLPIFQGVEIPKIDLMGITGFLPMLGIQPETDGQSASFTIPYELVKQLLSMVTMMVPAEAAGQLAPVLGPLNAMVQNDSGFALEGKVSDDGETAELLIDLYTVEGGVTADAPTGGLYIASTLNADTVQLLLYQEGQSYTIAEINLASSPEEAILALTANLMGQVNFSLSLSPDEAHEGCQVVALEIGGNGQTIAASLNYGDLGDTQFCDVAADFAGMSAFSMHIDEHPAADGSKEGSMTVSAQNNTVGQLVQFSANLQEINGEFDFRSIDNVANAYNSEALTAEEQAALNADLNNALAPLMQYIGSVVAQPAA